VVTKNSLAHSSLERKSPFARGKKTKVRKEKRSASREASPIDSIGLKAS